MSEIYIDNVITGNCLEVLRKMDEKSIANITTSPPYFKQREYGEDENEIGCDESLHCYLSDMLRVFVQCVRVLKDDGSIFWNLGDKYGDAGLMLIPYRFAMLAQQETKVSLVNNITWAKTNPTPRQDRTKMVSSTEPFFHFVKRGHKYKYYLDRISEVNVVAPNPDSNIGQGYFKQIKESSLTEDQKAQAKQELGEAIQRVKDGAISSLRMKILGKHRIPFGGQDGGRKTQMETKGFTIIDVPGKYSMVRDILEYPVESIKGEDHPAVYPQKMVEKLIRLTTDEEDVVLDPFLGSGTTALAAKATGRHYVGIELYSQYAEQAKKRLSGEDKHAT